MPTAAKIVCEPRWPAFVAMAAAGGVYLALPERLSLGPSWLLLLVVFMLLIPIVLSHRRGDFHITKVFTIVANTAITIGMVASLALLIEGIPKHRDSPTALLRGAVALWVTNVLVFALWYWKLDAGGPLGRDGSRGKLDSSFLFPQMLEDEDTSWSPHFMDYLFLAFNTSTAFSPTDTAVAIALGQSGHDAAVVDFADDRCAAGRPRRKYSLVAIAAIQTHAAK